MIVFFRIMSQYTSRNGALGALLDEYEKAIDEFIQVISQAPTEKFSTVLDHETDNPDCKSFETICKHVIEAGYYYMEKISKSIDVTINSELNPTDTPDTVKFTLRSLMVDTERYLKRLITYFEDEDEFLEYPIKSSWGVQPLELVLEHGIVHVLRHRRQIQKFLLKL